MKRITIGLIITVALLSLLAAPIMAEDGGNKDDCNTITEGEVFYSSSHYLAGEAIPLGFDIFGYNYQGHMFEGSYANVYLGGYGYPPYEGDTEAYLEENPTVTTTWCWPYRDVRLLMKWNDAWISNKDCDGDGKLDRHSGYDSYIGSGAWETNHQYGSYELDGETYDWNYFCKIVAVPDDAAETEGIWFTADGTEIGPDIWSQFAIILEVYNDQGTGEHGVYYNAPAPTGFGFYQP